LKNRNDTVSPAKTTNPPPRMNQKQIKQAINGIATLLGSNPVLLAKELAGLKALLPGLDESAITRIVEKTKQPGFNPRQLKEEVGNVVSAVKAAGQK
jgi:hypothetical protein